MGCDISSGGFDCRGCGSVSDLRLSNAQWYHIYRSLAGVLPWLDPSIDLTVEQAAEMEATLRSMLQGGEFKTSSEDNFKGVVDLLWFFSHADGPFSIRA